MTLRNLHRVLLVVVITFPLTGCLFRSHKVQPREVSKAPLKTATQAELIEYVNTQAARVQSMQATVDIDTSVGGVKKGKVTDYKQIRGYVLARKPAMLRMIGLLPIVRNRAFDMVSDGQVFKLWIPPKNRFIIGRNDIETHNIQQPLENLRPQQIYDALLLPQIDQKNEIAVVENSTEIVRDAKGHNLEQPNYEIDVIRNGEHGWFLARKILLDRKSTRLNSSHGYISYAVFCLKKKKILDLASPISVTLEQTTAPFSSGRLHATTTLTYSTSTSSDTLPIMRTRYPHLSLYSLW